MMDSIIASIVMVLKCAIGFLILFLIWQILATFSIPDESQPAVPWSQRRESLHRNFTMFMTDRNDSTVVGTTIGWRRDPIYRQDGYIEVKGPTPSGNQEYKRLIRLGKRK